MPHVAVPTRRRRRGVLALLLVGAATAGLAGIGVVAPASGATVASVAGPAGHDYATDHFSDPWDYSNVEDLITDRGPTWGASSISVAGGSVSAHFTASGYVSPIWGGYPGSAYTGRDGGRPGNALDANTYRTIAFRAFSSTAYTSALYWFSCPGAGVAASCGGAQTFQLQPGWHTYILNPGASTIAGWPLRWGGSINGLRLGASANTDLALDWMRVVQPGSGTNVTWSNPSGGTGQLLWQTVSSSQPGSGSLGAVTGTSGTRNITELPAGTYQIGVANSAGTVASWTQVTLMAPLPRILAPNEAGDRDYAYGTLHNPWDMHDPADVAAVGNATAVSWAGGQLAATNTTNDPYAAVRLAPGGLGGVSYHRLSVTSAYDGPFNLADMAGGGTMGRVQWARADGARGQSADLLTYSGVRTITLDLANPANFETDVPVSAFSSPSPVTMFRWDPNEDRGARRWYLRNVSLRSDFRTTGDFVVSWTDLTNSPDSTATLVADRDQVGCNGVTIASNIPVVPNAINQTPWQAAPAGAGPWWICLRITHGDAVTQTYSSAPVVVGANPPAPDQNPQGAWESATGSASGGNHTVRVTGWAFDPSNPSLPLQVQLVDRRPDGSVVTSTIRDSVARFDVATVFRGTTVVSGYDATLATTPGTHTMCMTALDIGIGDNKSLGCRTVAVP